MLAAGAGAFAALAGCVASTRRGESPTGSEAPTAADAPTRSIVPASPDVRRPTLTPRDPRPLDVSGAWLQQGFDAGHRGATDAVGVPTDGRAYWHLRRVRSGPPVLADGRLFHHAKLGAEPSGTPTATRTKTAAGLGHAVYGDPALLARDAATGDVGWFRKLRGPATGWPAAAGDRVVVAANGQLAAFRARDGTRLWDRDLGDRALGDPTLVDGTAVVPLSGAVDGRTGERVRQQRVRTYSVADGSPGWSVDPPKRSLRVAVGGDTVVVTAAGYDGTGVVTGRGLADGSRRWRVELAADFFGRPAAASDAAFVPTSENRLVALALADGAERWRVLLRRRAAGVAVAGDTCYVADGSLRALAVADGDERWSVSPPAGVDYVGVPAVGRDAVYVGTDATPASFVAVARSSGDRRWSHRLRYKLVHGDVVDAGLVDQPVVADGAVYANAIDGLYAFGPA